MVGIQLRRLPDYRITRDSFILACMMRIATAMLALLSLLAAPAVSVACGTRCDLKTAHRSPACHGHASAPVDHAVHAHSMPMPDQGSGAAMADQERGEHPHLLSAACHSGICATAVPAQPAPAIVYVWRVAAISCSSVIALCNSSLAAKANDGSEPSPAVDYPPGASAPLRI